MNVLPLCKVCIYTCMHISMSTQTYACIKIPSLCRILAPKPNHSVVRFCNSYPAHRACMYVCMFRMWVCMWVCMCICVCACTYVALRFCSSYPAHHVCMHLCMYCMYSALQICSGYPAVCVRVLACVFRTLKNCRKWAARYVYVLKICTCTHAHVHAHVRVYACIFLSWAYNLATRRTEK
jgi:hypothetical protein